MKAVWTALGIAAVAALVIGVREATISRHVARPPDSVMEVVVEASTNDAEASLPDLVTALFGVCQLEVHTDPVGAPERDGDRFRFLIQPALDETDQRQLHGCLEDAIVDHLQASVESMREVTPA